MKEEEGVHKQGKVREGLLFTKLETRRFRLTSCCTSGSVCCMTLMQCIDSEKVASYVRCSDGRQDQDVHV